MHKLLKADNGMNIIGQGAVIVRFTLPWVCAAVLVHLFSPQIAALPFPRETGTGVGIALLLAGVVLWLTAVWQLLTVFSKGKLVKTGAYGACRHPIYASYGLFILPSISLLTGTWVYLVAGAFLCVGVKLFIRKEEAQLLTVFGAEYAEYTEHVSRLMPFIKPARGLR